MAWESVGFQARFLRRCMAVIIAIHAHFIGIMWLFKVVIAAEF